MIEKIKQQITILTIVIILSVFIFILFLYIKFNISNTEGLAQLGSFIGGVFGTIIALIVFVYVKKTYDLQEKELKSTKDYIKKQQFESTFFNMLSMINTIGTSLTHTDYSTSIYTPTPLIGNEFYKFFIGKIKLNYSTIHKNNTKFNNFLVNNISKLEPNNPDFFIDNLDFELTLSHENLIEDLGLIEIWKKNNDEAYCGFVYHYWYLETDTQLSHLFRYIYNTMRFVIEEVDGFDNQKNYIKLIQAQLSNYQLAVMFYSGISQVSRNSKGEYMFKEIADNYGIFQNIEKSYLLNATHFDFYPNTKFKNK
jgi:hypothetical protein